jgi:hypothetical protein
MAKYVLILNSAAKPGRADEYSDWCRNQHFPDILRIPGVTGAKRYRFMGKSGDEQARFVSIFDLDCDDPQEILNEMRQRNGTPAMPVSDSYDPTSVSMAFAQIELELTAAD